MLKHSLVALAALGAGLIGLPATQASAFPTVPSAHAPGDTMIVDVNHWRSDHRDRCDRWSSHCRYRHGGYFYSNPWWLLPMVGAGITLGSRGYDRGYGSRHVEWCLDRYRSYDPRTNTWVAYSGRVHQCVSPYGP